MLSTILRRLQGVLDRYKVPYQVLPHSETYTAQETAEVQRVPGDQNAFHRFGCGIFHAGVNGFDCRLTRGKK